MILTSPLETLGLKASLFVATIYRESPDRECKVYNSVTTR